MWLDYTRLGFLGRLIRVYQFKNEVTLIALLRKVGVTPEELEAVAQEAKSRATPEDLKSFEADFLKLFARRL